MSLNVNLSHGGGAQKLLEYVNPDPVAIYKRTRPSDWLPMPPDSDINDDEIYMLVHIPKGQKRFITISPGSDPSGILKIINIVELGTMNGEKFSRIQPPIETNGIFAEEINSSDYGDETSDGNVQCMMKISNAGNTSFTQLSTKPYTNSAGVNLGNFPFGIKEIKMRSTKMTQIQLSSFNDLRYFTQVGESSITSYKFSGCERLVAAIGVNTAKSSAIDSLFNNCYNLEAFDEINLNSITSANGVFNNCKKLKKIDLKSKKFQKISGYPFQGCSSIEQILNFDISGCTSAGYGTAISFARLYSLKRLTFSSGAMSSTYSIDLTDCRGIEHDSLVETLNSIPTTTLSNKLTLTKVPGAYELTDMEKAIATKKGWSLVI